MDLHTWPVIDVLTLHKNSKKMIVIKMSITIKSVLPVTSIYDGERLRAWSTKDGA